MAQKHVTIYFNPRCSKSRQTLELLQQQGIEPEVIEYMKDPPDIETLKKITAMLGLPIRDLLRTTEQDFKDAGMDDADLTDDDIYEAISECPTLLQRPIVIIDNEKAALGRPAENILKIL